MCHESAASLRLLLISNVDAYLSVVENVETDIGRHLDLANGVEFKTLAKVMSANTANGYLKNASRKRGCTSTVFDNTGNALLTDMEVSNSFLVQKLLCERGLRLCHEWANARQIS